MEIIENSAVKFIAPTHIVDSIINNIEKSEVLENRGNLSEVLVYWGLDEMTRLNQLVSFRNNLPSPIVRDYTWPGLYIPFKHQKVTSEFLSINRKAFCFNR